jgi:hypothetical protein
MGSRTFGRMRLRALDHQRFDRRFAARFYEQLTPDGWDQIRKAGEGASDRILNGELTVIRPKPRLTVVE